MSAVPDREELSATLVRMEAQYKDISLANMELLPIYTALCKRFDRDLADERDKMLCRAGALMMVKYLLDAGHADGKIQI